MCFDFAFLQDRGRQPVAGLFDGLQRVYSAVNLMDSSRPENPPPACMSRRKDSPRQFAKDRNVECGFCGVEKSLPRLVIYPRK